MKVITQERTFREISGSMAITQADDAWHPHKSRKYIEWWYFDVLTGDGSLVRGQFYISRDVFRPWILRPGVRATYVAADGTEITIDEKFSYSEFGSSTETCDVKIGRNFIKGDLLHYELHVEDADKSLDLRLNTEVDGFKSYACFGDENTYMYWVVPQPHGHATGTFKTKHGSVEIDGIGYRDHNWLNFFPPDVISYWDWGRVHDREFTIIFAEIVTVEKFEKTRVKPLVIYDSSKLLYVTGEAGKWNLIKADTGFNYDAGIELPDINRVELDDGDLRLELDLHLERVFQKIDPLTDFNPLTRFLLRTFKGRPSIISLFSRGSGQLNIAGSQNALTCTAVHELVRNS